MNRLDSVDLRDLSWRIAECDGGWRRAEFHKVATGYNVQGYQSDRLEVVARLRKIARNFDFGNFLSFPLVVEVAPATGELPSRSARLGSLEDAEEGYGGSITRCRVFSNFAKCAAEKSERRSNIEYSKCLYVYLFSKSWE